MENERFGLFCTKTGSINSGTGAGDEHLNINCSKNYGVGGLEVQIYVMRRCQFMPEEGKWMQEWLQETS